ncbi:hypothetical protein M0R72_12465 [Candidatus Pacearchaeota archaeon]|jgi:hypothetical protein|nr:hypothetical protein [Candidatus Pacearchaeota archaeon]
MTKEKAASDKYPSVLVTYRPDQKAKVSGLQAKRELSKRFQEMLDAIC